MVWVLFLISEDKVSETKVLDVFLHKEDALAAAKKEMDEWIDDEWSVFKDEDDVIIWTSLTVPEGEGVWLNLIQKDLK